MIQGKADTVGGNGPRWPAVDMDVIKPERPHDDLAFEELAHRYNCRLTSNPKHLFTRLVVKECRSRPSPVRVLDIAYRFNGERRIDACAKRLRFQSPEYAYVEAEPPVGYQPGPLRPLFHVFTIKRQLFKSPKARSL